MIPFWNNLTQSFEFPAVPNFLGFTDPAYLNYTGNTGTVYFVIYDLLVPQTFPELIIQGFFLLVIIAFLLVVLFAIYVPRL